MNRLINVRPLAGAAVLAVAAMGVAPAFATVPHASASSLSRVNQQALSVSGLFRGTVVGLHRTQLAAEISLANGAFVPVRFASAAQQQRLRLGTSLIVSGVARSQARVVVRSLRVMGATTRAHIQGKVARRLRGAVEVLGLNGAAVTIGLGHARITRVVRRAGRFVRTAASVAPGEQLDTAVTLTGSGPEATGTATVTPPPPPSGMSIEVGGIITAVDPAAGTITVNDDEGFTSVVSVSGAGNYAVGQDVDVVGYPTGPGGSATSVQAQYVTRDAPEAAEPSEGAEPPEYNTPEPPEPPDYD
jgi:hypothetical protein